MIYFAFRSAELPNQRHIKAFDADNVLDFFVKHWQALSCHEGVKQLLGVYVYGFPIADYQSFDPVGIPKDFAQLVSIIERYVYCNEVIGDNDCLQVLTDDDEIELAWYVFSDDYKNANLDKVALWFYEDLPVALPKDEQDNHQFDNEWLDDIATIDIIENKQKYTYLMACTIYDSSNLEGITVKALAGVHYQNCPKVYWCYLTFCLMRTAIMIMAWTWCKCCNILPNKVRLIFLPSLPNMIWKAGKAIRAIRLRLTTYSVILTAWKLG